MSQTVIVHTEFSPEKRIFTGVSCLHHRPQIYENLALLPNLGNLQLAVVSDCTPAPAAIAEIRSNPVLAPLRPSPATRNASPVPCLTGLIFMLRYPGWITRS